MSLPPLLPSGQFLFNGKAVAYGSGVSIARFPTNGLVLSASLTDLEAKITSRPATKGEPVVLGLHVAGAGKVVVYGDSTCFDDARAPVREQRCLEFLDHLVECVIPFQAAWGMWGFTISSLPQWQLTVWLVCWHTPA